MGQGEREEQGWKGEQGHEQEQEQEQEQKQEREHERGHEHVEDVDHSALEALSHTGQPTLLGVVVDVPEHILGLGAVVVRDGVSRVNSWGGALRLALARIEGKLLREWIGRIL